jgi:diguanylate cyclase (GGDEF)-like protein
VRDVLYVGREDAPEVADLRGGGLAVATAASLPAAVEDLRRAPGTVAVVEGALLEGRDAERIDVLRSAGAGCVVVVYAAADAWKAARAATRGADAGVALPAPPGALPAIVARLAGAAAPPVAPPIAPQGGTTTHALAPTAAEPLRAGWLESVVADVAVLQRGVENVDRLLDQVLEAFRRRSQAERASILLFDRRRQALHVRRTTAVADPATLAPVPVDAGLPAHVARTGEPLLVADVARLSPDLGARPDPTRGYRTPSCLLLPLRGAHDVVGVVCLADRRAGGAFAASDLPPLRFLADQSGQAIENAIRYREMQELAAIDELTGLANRRQFQRSLEREVQRARRYDRQLTLALLDLDHFKQFNDRCGHPAGDRALAMVGEILRTSLREVDVVARYGGEEFAVILPETAARPSGSASTPFPFLERLRRRIEETAFPGAEKLPGGRLTVSGGIACFPDDAATVDELIRAADRALYRSKAAGRNTITYRERPLS